MSHCRGVDEDGDWIFSRGERDRFADDACAINYLLQKAGFF